MPKTLEPKRCDHPACNAWTYKRYCEPCARLYDPNAMYVQADARAIGAVTVRNVRYAKAFQSTRHPAQDADVLTVLQRFAKKSRKATPRKVREAVTPHTVRHIPEASKLPSIRAGETY